MAGSDYYNHTSYPVDGALGSVADMQAELNLIEDGFGKLPTLTANLMVAVNSAGTALESIATTGTGSGVKATTPTLTTPVLGVATVTSVNKVAITAPSSSATLTIANGATLATVGAYSATLTSTATTNVTLPTTGTLSTLAGTESLSNKTLVTPALGTPASGDLTNCTFPSWKLLQTATAATSAAIPLLTGITSTYDVYMITYSQVIPGSEPVRLDFQISQDGGATWKAGATDYKFGLRSYGSDASDVSTNGTGTGLYMTPATIGSNANFGISGEIMIYGPSSAAGFKRVVFNNSHVNASQVVFRTVGSGMFELNSTAINGFRLLMSGGNITSGKFALYGLSK